MKVYIPSKVYKVSGLKSSNTITPLSKVCVLDFYTKNKEWYTFDKRDNSFNFVSPESPVGKALLGKEIGDVIEVVVPSGKRILEIIRII